MRSAWHHSIGKKRETPRYRPTKFLRGEATETRASLCHPHLFSVIREAPHGGPVPMASALQKNIPRTWPRAHMGVDVDPLLSLARGCVLGHAPPHRGGRWCHLQYGHVAPLWRYARHREEIPQGACTASRRGERSSPGPAGEAAGSSAELSPVSAAELSVCIGPSLHYRKGKFFKSKTDFSRKIRVLRLITIPEFICRRLNLPPV